MPHEQSWRELSPFPEDQEPRFSQLFERIEVSHPITDSVLRLEERCLAMIGLAGEMLATIQLEGNAHLFAEFPDDWNAWVDAWQKRYDKLVKNVQK